MKAKYDKLLFELIEVCQTDAILASGEPQNFNKDWLSVIEED